MMKINLNNQSNKVSDLALATTISLYFPIQSIQPIDGRKVVFVFDKTPEVDDLISKFWSGGLMVEPQQYFNQLKVIKTRIYSRI